MKINSNIVQKRKNKFIEVFPEYVAYNKMLKFTYKFQVFECKTFSAAHKIQSKVQEIKIFSKEIDCIDAGNKFYKQ